MSLCVALAHLVAYVDVCTIVQEVLHRFLVSMATCCDEGRVAGVAVLAVELRWVFREESKKPRDVSGVGCLASWL